MTMTSRLNVNCSPIWFCSIKKERVKGMLMKINRGFQLYYLVLGYLNGAILIEE